MADRPEIGRGTDETDGPAAGRPAPREFGLGWLADLARESLDPGYAEAAAHRGSGHRRSSTPAVLRVAVAMLVAGLAVGVAVGWRQLTAPADDRARSSVLDDVRSAQQRQDELATTAAALQQRIELLQARAGRPAPDAALRVDAGLTAVAGPGVVVTVDVPGDPALNPVRDVDLQLLVNGVWASGAEAVSVGGVRLRATSSVRQAGGAILVDNKPVTWPISVQAIGDPARLLPALVAGPGYGRLQALQANDGVRLEVTTPPTVSLPAAPLGGLRYAAPLASGSSSSPTPGAEPTR